MSFMPQHRLARPRGGRTKDRVRPQHAEWTKVQTLLFIIGHRAIQEVRKSDNFTQRGEKVQRSNTMQLFSGLLGTLLSPLKSNHAPVEPDTSSEEDFSQVIKPKIVTTDDGPRKVATKRSTAAMKKKSNRNINSNKPRRAAPKKKATTATTSMKKTGTTTGSGRRGMVSSKPVKAKAVAKSKTPIKHKVKSEPVWERRSRRRTRGYRKGGLAEGNLINKAWRGSGTKNDPLVLH